MSKATYAYGVARIRAMEMSLFTSAVIEQLMALIRKKMNHILSQQGRAALGVSVSAICFDEMLHVFN